MDIYIQDINVKKKHARRIKTFPISSFLAEDFSFSFRRMVHTPEEYNEKVLHRREFWKIIYVVTGHGQKLINNKSYPLNPGGLFLIHPQDCTSFIIESPQIEICNILFMPELIYDGLRELKDDFSFFSILQRNFSRDNLAAEQLYIADTNRNIDHVVKNLEYEYSKRPQNYRVLIKINLLELLIRLCRKASGQRRQVGRQDVIAYVEHLIDHHFQREFNLEFLAGKLGISKSHLCRIYRASTGCTIMESLRNRRLREAASRLSSSSQLSISDICYDCGFRDLSYFYRAFKVSFGKNPGEYRRSFGLD